MGTVPGRAIATIAAALVAAGGLVACSSSDQPDRRAAQSYLDAYGARNAGAAGAFTTDQSAATSALDATLHGLPGATPQFRIDAVRSRQDTSSTVAYTATWKFPNLAATWTYSATLAMTKIDKSWKVAWNPAVVAPGLAGDQHLAETRTAPTRGALNDSSGQALFTEQPVVTVGIDPQTATDTASLAARLAAVPQLQSTAAEITAAVTGAPAGTAYIPIITLRRDVYLTIRDQIHDVPGTAFQESTRLLGPTSTFAQPLLGTVGPATADQISASKGALSNGDVVGEGGLQEALNTELAGTPGLTIQAVDSSGKVVNPDLTVVAAPQAGDAVTLTLDSSVQNAAEAALAGVDRPASIVVTKPSTGAVLAVANSASADGDIGLSGQYPPGSTFKIATYTAVFGQLAGTTPDTPVVCPGTTTVNGQTVRNENNFEKGTIAISSAFAFSCNTSAAQFALQLPNGGLYQAAHSLGLGQKWSLPVDAFSGSMPTAAQSNELAAEGYGQGQVLVSPLLMAEMAGGAATGAAIAPSLVTGQAGTKLDAQNPIVTGYLNTLMRDVVTVPGATGRALAGLPGNPEGKTGTAEFGTDVPPAAHSWFAGTRGDLAFAVFVYGGEASTESAVPIAKAFLSAAPQ